MQSKSKSKGKKYTGFKKYPQLSLGWDVPEVNPSRSKSKEIVIKLNSVQSSKKLPVTKTQPKYALDSLDYFPTQSNIKSKQASTIKSEIKSPKAQSRSNKYNDPIDCYGLSSRDKFIPKDNIKGIIYHNAQPSVRSSSRSSSRPKDNILSLGDGYNYFKDDKNPKTTRLTIKTQGAQKITVKSPRNIKI